MGHVAERTPAGADIAHDHEGGGTVAKTLAEIRTGRFLAYGMQMTGAQKPFDSGYRRTDRRLGPDPWRFT